MRTVATSLLKEEAHVRFHSVCIKKMQMGRMSWKDLLSGLNLFVPLLKYFHKTTLRFVLEHSTKVN